MINNQWQMAGAPESLYVRLENREMVAIGNIYCDSRVCKKNQLSLLSVDIRRMGVGKTFCSGPIKTFHFLKNRHNSTDNGRLPAIWLN